MLSATTSSISGLPQVIDAGGHELHADESPTVGGSGTGPRPTELVLAGLAACTSITLRMYADRKGFSLGTIRVSIVLREVGGTRRIERHIAFSAPIASNQRARLAEISDNTPVTKLLKAGIAIDTTVD